MAVASLFPSTAAIEVAQSGSLLILMLRIFSRASGEEVATLALSELPEEDGVLTIGSLKRYLAKEHFNRRCSRFQLRVVREGDPHELRDDETISPPLDFQLLALSHLPPNEDRDSLFRDKCMAGDLEEVARNLHDLQNPNVSDPDDCWIVSPLLVASQYGHTEVVRLLLEAGAHTERYNFGDDKMRALHCAASGGHFEVLCVLLEFGADIDAHTEDWFCALHLAAMTNNVNIVHLLLDSGAAREPEDLQDMTPLHHAALRGHVAVARVLLDFGVALEAMDSQGQRPLHWAAIYGEVGAVSLLLDYGAEKEAATFAGLTPCQLAEGNGHVAVVELLNQATGNIESCPLAK